MTFTQVLLTQFRFAKYQILILNCMQILINKLKYLHLPTLARVNSHTQAKQCICVSMV